MSLEKGIYRSSEEVYFSWYLDELVEHGYVSWYKYESKKFKLLDEAKSVWYKKVRANVVATQLHLLQDIEYTPDFEICFTEKALGIFCNGTPSKTITAFIGAIEDEITGEYIAFIDVKGANGHSGTSFTFVQKIAWDKLRIYFQKIIPFKLFNKTFTPKRYLYTDGGNQLRASKNMKKVISIEEYIKKMQ